MIKDDIRRVQVAVYKVRLVHKFELVCKVYKQSQGRLIRNLTLFESLGERFSVDVLTNYCLMFGIDRPIEDCGGAVGVIP